MAKVSAGVLLYRRRGDGVEVLLVHPGGPFWRGKDQGAWSIPMGEAEEEEELLATAVREFEEELGVKLSGPFVELAPVRQKGGKVVHAFACEGDVDVGAVRSNVFEMEWPPRSGKRQQFPEVDRVEWFAVAEARGKINAAQVQLLVQLERAVQG